MDIATMAVVESEVTVYCLCGASETGRVRSDILSQWQLRWLMNHPKGVDRHGPATEEQARKAREHLTWPIDNCAHVWVRDLAGDLVCVGDGGCGLLLIDWPEDRPLPTKGASWDQVVLTKPGRLLIRRRD